MREIKFRAWDKLKKEMILPWELSLRHGDIMDFMQFTGLKDKNGKEIYESDIVQSVNWGQPQRAKGIVVFEGYRWVTVPKNRGSHKTSYEMWSDVVGKEGEGVEVIGNIYKTPELLKGTK